MTRIQKNHNYCLSADRVVIENIFARIKGRFRRLIYINAYSISKCVEIAVAACVLHNFCYMNKDEWDDHLFNEPEEYNQENNLPDAQETRLAKAKRDRIAEQLVHQ